MILYYSTKFHVIIINSFRVIGRGHFPPPALRSWATLKKPRRNRVNPRLLLIKGFFINPIRPAGGGRGWGGGEPIGFWCPCQLWIACIFRQLKIMLPYHNTFPHVLLKFEFLAYFVDLIELWCLGSSISVTLSTLVLRNMISRVF